MRRLLTSRQQLEFNIEDRQSRLNASKVAYVITIFYMPAGSLLDYIIYRDLFWDFLLIRLLESFLLAIILPLLFLNIGRKFVKIWPLFLGLITSAVISWMIYKTEGANSVYYGGLNLVILVMSVLIPWSLWETMILWLGTLFLYTVACLAHSQIINIEVSFFIFLTGLACVISTYLASKARLKDFLLRQQLNERNDELQRLDQQKTQFFSNISHELRTPLTLILSPIQDLLHKSEKLPDQVHKTLLLAMQNSLRLLKLINDLLEVTRLEQAEFKADFKRIEAGGMVKSLAHSIRHLAIAKEIKLQIEGAKEPLWILGDLSLLEKVFLNLFTNAIKFTKEGGVIYVRCRKDGEQVFFEVEDTGIGIPEKELPNIFDRFHQVDGSSTRKYQGVGIGLSLVRDLVHKHGGKIEVKSEEGKGTCFQICLKGAPAQTDEEAVTLSTQTSSIPKASQDPLLAAFKSADRFLVHHEESEALPEIGQGEFTLLVVDDEPDMRRFITSTVSEKYTIIQAADGVSGLELAKARRPHLILLDWMLPGMSGPEVCKKIKGDKETRGIKILMLTAKMDEESKIEGLNAGADDFLVKPFSTLELQSRVKNHLNTAALEADLRESNQELQQALDHLKATESQLIQSEKMNAMGNLSAGLLHEINNPLNFSLTALSFASQSLSSDDEMVREALDDIENGLGRVRDIVSDLRIFAYPDEKGSLEWVSMEEPIKSALRMLSHELNNVEFESQVCNDSIAYLCRQQITHVVINLISNSVKATKDTAAKRKPQIYLKVEKVEDEYLRLSVKDNGCGVSQETLKKVFNPFFTTREVGEGLGIGLSLCHTLVKNHKGTIDMRSKEGEWTEVIVTLPINPAEGKDDSRNRLLQSI